MLPTYMYDGTAEAALGPQTCCQGRDRAVAWGILVVMGPGGISLGVPRGWLLPAEARSCFVCTIYPLISDGTKCSHCPVSAKTSCFYH